MAALLAAAGPGGALSFLVKSMFSLDKCVNLGESVRIHD